MRLSRLATASGLITLLLLVAVAVSWRQFAAEPAHAVNEAMALDCNASTPAVDASCSYPAGSTFSIAVHATNAGSGYAGYQVKVRWTDAVLDYLPAADPATENQWPVTCLAARLDNQPGDPSVLYSCAQLVFPPATPVVSTHVGSVVQFQMQCQGAGPAGLTLVPRAGDPQVGSHFVDALFQPIDPVLTNASVTCLAGPTPTPAVTPTATPNLCRLVVVPASGSFEVRVEQCTGVAGVGFQVNFDPAILRVEARTAGPDFPAGCNVQVDTIDNGAGFVDFGCIIAPLSGSNGGGLVARYSLSCAAEGTSALTLKETELVDSLARPLPHQVSSGSFVCSAGQVTPASPTSTPPLGATPTRTPTGVGPTPTRTRTPTGVGPTATRTPTRTPTGVGPTPTRTPIVEKACGDVDDRGGVTSIDALIVLQLGARLISSLPNAPSADVNGDGQITAIDATLILQLVAGLLGDLDC